MRPLYDEFEDFDFGDTDVVSKLMREQQREELRLASRRRSRNTKHRWDNAFEDEDEDEFSNVSSYEELDIYDDYDEDEFDSYADLGNSR
jgi:hypothetical protein